MATIIKTNSLVDSQINLNGVVFLFNTQPSALPTIQTFTSTNYVVEVYNSGIDGQTPVSERTNDKGDIIKKYYLTTPATYTLENRNVTKVVSLLEGTAGDGKGAICGVSAGSATPMTGIFYDKQFLFLKDKIKGNNNIYLKANYAFQNDFDISVFDGYINVRRLQLAYCKNVRGDISSLLDSAPVISVMNFQGTQVEGVLDVIVNARKDVASANSSISAYFAGTRVTFNGEPTDNVKFTFDGQGGYTVEDL